VRAEKDYWLEEEARAGLKAHTRLAGVIREFYGMIAESTAGCRPLKWPDVTGARTAYLSKVRERIAHLDDTRKFLVLSGFAHALAERFDERFVEPILEDLLRRDSQGVPPRTKDPFDTVEVGAPNSTGEEAVGEDLSDLPPAH
jgi:hypothetical protein